MSNSRHTFTPQRCKANWLPLAAAILPVMLQAAPAMAFDYLEHSYFTDRACRAVQDKLAERLHAKPNDEQLVSRYLALAIVCPNDWKRPYCAGGYKQPEANVNRLPAPATQSSDLAITLGDFAALPDHISRWGPLRNIPGAKGEGLITRVFTWMATEPDDAGGIIGDVSEDACETDDLVPWESVEADVAGAFVTSTTAAMPASLLSPLRRAAVPRGPRDPAGAYSFDNPHFLDLVVRGTHHFGEQAYSSWLGFHSTAIEVASKPCADVQSFEGDDLEDMSDGHPLFEDLDWDDMPWHERNENGCRFLASLVATRLAEWVVRAEPGRVEPVLEYLAGLNAKQHADAPKRLEKVVTALMALAFEGSGLHFLQDGLAAGHMRGAERRHGLGERRFDHDFDNREGLVAVLQTGSGESRFVAFGDSYLMGPQPSTDTTNCNWQAFAKLYPGAITITTCLVRYHRGVLATATAASLMDWSLGGPMFDTDATNVSPCERNDTDTAFICRHLPLQATTVPGLETFGAPKSHHLHYGAMPLPNPPFEYESLAFHISTDLGGSANQLGLDFALYDTLGIDDEWLTSYRLGVRTSQSDAGVNSFVSDFSYGFHWRWAARFLVDAEPFVYAGARGPSEGRAFYMGAGPRVGITVLPEGWIKLPVEIGISYRLPVNLVTSDKGFFGKSIDIEARWLQFSLGLAFL